MGKDKGGTQADKTAITNLANTMTATGNQSAAEGSQLFNLALPGLESAEGYYGKLSTGDPTALARANAPAIAGITQQSDSAKKNIVQDNPRGGARDLALANADISKGAQISGLTTGSYTDSFKSLAGLSGDTISRGTSATSTGLQGLSSAAGQYNNLLQNNASGKASSLGFLGSLAGAGAELGTAAILA